MVLKKQEFKENVSSASPSQQQLNNLIEYYQTGQYGDAESSALSITQEFPKHPFGWKILGAVLGQTDRKHKAEIANRKTVILSPLDAEAHSNLASTLYDLARLEEAEISLRQAIRLKNDFAEAHRNLGVTLKEMGKIDEAAASFRQAIASKPN